MVLLISFEVMRHKGWIGHLGGTQLNEKEFDMPATLIDFTSPQAIVNYLNELRQNEDGTLPNDTTWEQGFICGLANASAITVEVEDECLRLLDVHG